MKISKFLFVVVAMALFTVSISPVFASKKPTPSAASLLQDAHKQAIVAQGTQGKLPQGQAFSSAISDYRDVIKQDDNSPDAAIAMLETGEIYAGVPVGQAPPSHGDLKAVYKSRVIAGLLRKETNLQNDYTARDQFNQLIARFESTKPSKLEDYGPDASAKIKMVVDQATQYKKLVENRMDKVNSKKIPYKIMDALVRLTGKHSYSYWIAIILITLIVKVITSPLTKAQFKSMREMQKLQPLMKELQEKYKGDQKVLNEKIMELYKEHGVNPVAGCLPLLVQMPILIGLYYTIRTYEIQFAHGTFLWIGWAPFVHRTALPLLSGRLVWLTAANLAQPDLILLVLYTISMFVSQKLAVVDPQQAESQKMMSVMMPVMFFFLIGYLPSAFMLYWFVFNLLQTWQQYHIIHSVQPVAVAAETEAAPATETERVVQPSRRRRRRR